MSQAVRVRRARADEPLADVAALQEATFHRGWGVEALRREIAPGGAGRLYRLERADGALLGFCACWAVADELHINSLAIDPAVRRQGLARRLLIAVLREVAAEGVVSATLEVRRSNVAAVGLYAGLGFSTEGVRRDYYEQPREDALVLWCRGLADAAVKW